MIPQERPSSPLDSIGRFHHVGVAVRAIESMRAFLTQALGGEVASEAFCDSNQGVRIQFVRVGSLMIELLEPAASPSPVDAVLARGIGVYHVCYEVESLDDALSKLTAAKSARVTVVSPPKPAVAFGGRRVAFVMHQGLMIELIDGLSPDGGGNP